MLRTISTRLAPAITLAAQTAAATVTGTSVDLQGFGAVSFQLAIGVGGITFTGTNRVDFSVEHSDDNSTWVAATAAEVNLPGGFTWATGGIVRSLTAAKAAADVQEIDYIGNRRYVRLTATFGGTHATGTPISCLAVRGLPELMPA
ncbi:hypothetical protein [Paracraurococcus ruber]|uniref:Uncharacterized protein n=1 Tax=Paracraurococcus ruber TaxID=77675 RepID=A0ABS1CQY2_9PROT|nr:hypothetical protein [Paracraurococcus ruber]MBK1656849.1 hypothetical protein [Paracraurococcus ruber]TDG33964.1 hypothetical protein E2C05_01610 [Paracraurococcus ruber]